MTKIIRKIIVSTFALMLTSCAGTGDSIIGRQAAPVDPTGEFDLSEYLFHEQVSSETGSMGYTEKYYKKNEDIAVVLQPEFRYIRNGETIDVQSSGIDGLTYQYTVTDSAINEFHPTLDDSRSYERYAQLGDTYLNAELTSVNVNETCVLSEFFETYHLSSATGKLKISNKTYDNVIKVRCRSEFTNRNENRTNYRWNVYYAKDIGPVFKDGNWENYLGNIYAIYDY